MSNDTSLSCLPATLGCRFSGGDADMRTSRCYKFIQVSVIPLLLGDIGHEAGGTRAGADRTWPYVSDFHSAVLHGVVTEQQYDFFHEYCHLHLPLFVSRNLVYTAKEVIQTVGFC